jgi:16S rRNA (adenine1518-N6/adenine1519-N6)-dimethyltransferase
VLERIAVAACPTPQNLAIEIGPGRGALTEKLLKRAARVIAIEVDPYLAGHLEQKFAGEPRLEVVRADVLETDLARWGPAVIVGNLPYYITSPILEKTVRLRFPRAVFLVQKEVAQRLAAQPGCRDYGFLTVQTALYAAVRLLFEVKPAAFHPPPKVDSAVVRLTPRPDVSSPSSKAFLDFVSQCFRHKRKTIRNNLLGVYEKIALDGIRETAKRAEQMSIEELLSLYEKLRQTTLRPGFR